MKPCIIITYLICSFQISIKAQIVHAGVWTGYVDRIGITKMVMRDSHIYFQTRTEIAHFNTESRVCNFFADLGNYDLPAIINLSVSDIDAQGKLWAVFDQQLINILPDGTVNIVGPAPAYKVSYLKFDHNDQLWVGMNTENTTTHALVAGRFINNGWEYFSTGPYSSKVIYMAFDSQNKPYLLTPNIYEFNGNNFQLFPAQVLIPGSIKEINFSNDGQIILLPFIRKYENGTWISDPGNGYLQKAAFDESNVLWTANQFSGIYKNFPPVFELNAPVNYRSIIGEMADMGFDLQGNLWIGGKAGLFTRSPDNQWEFVPTSPLLTIYQPHALAAEKDTVWMATTGPTQTIVPGPITSLYNDTFQTYDLQPLDVRCMRYDTIRKGLWIGGNDQFGFLKNGVYTEVDVSQFTDPIIRDIQQDKNGNIWIASYNTLLRYSPEGTWHTFKCGVELPNPTISGISVIDTTLYVSLTRYTGGPVVIPKIVKINGDNVVDMNIQVGIPNNGWPGYFAAQSDSCFWYAAGWGNSDLYRWKNGIETVFTSSDLGYYGSAQVQQIFVYDTSTVLACSNNGLFIYKNNTWYKPVIPSDKIINYSCVPSFLYGKKLIMSTYDPLLVIEDIEGLFDELVPVTAPSSGTDYTRLIYPNPVSGKTNIDPEVLRNHPDCRLSLYNSSGTLIRHYKAPLPPEIDTQDFPGSGVYFLQFWSFKDGFKQVVKMVKN